MKPLVLAWLSVIGGGLVLFTLWVVTSPTASNAPAGTLATVLGWSILLVMVPGPLVVIVLGGLLWHRSGAWLLLVGTSIPLFGMGLVSTPLACAVDQRADLCGRMYPGEIVLIVYAPLLLVGGTLVAAFVGAVDRRRGVPDPSDSSAESCSECVGERGE